MCNVCRAGRSDEFTPESIEQIFSQKFFDKVKHVGVSGGEPTLNPYLTGVFEKLCINLPQLRTISMTSNGYHTHIHSDVLPKLKSICRSHKIKFSLNLSLDGYGQMHQKVRGVEGAFEKVVETAEVAKKFKIPVQFQCTISPVNVYNIIKVREFAIEKRYEIIFRLATYIARLSNKNLAEHMRLSDKQKSFVADFLEAPRTLFAAKSLGRRLFYLDVAKRIRTGGFRGAPCYFQSEALFISPDKKIYSCSRNETNFVIENTNAITKSIYNESNKNIMEDFLKRTCKECWHDQSGRWPLLKYLTVHQKLYRYLKLIDKARQIPLIIKAVIIGSGKVVKIGLQNKKYQNALIIGCYGGEHVGDAAILGGVILRIKKKYDIHEFIVASIRTDRTKNWVDNLNIPEVKLSVVEYSPLLDIDQYNLLILGGGPLMNIPILLARHFLLVERFRKQKKPFIIEGIGIGPIGNFFSRILIKKILAVSGGASVRTIQDNMQYNKMAGRKAVLTRDPAFDYLEHALKLPGTKQKTLEYLLGTDKEIWVINLRPLWTKYARGNTDIKSVEASTINVIADVLNEFKSSRRFIFMPMNADQFGFSDLEVAYRLEKQIDERYNDIDYQIWECEPDIGGCLELLKKTSLTISMRLHGCIFSLASRVRTIGLDYSLNSQGKVFALFKDLNMEGNAINIKELTLARLKNTILHTLSS